MSWWKRIEEINKTTDKRKKEGIGIYKKQPIKIKVSRPLCIPIKRNNIINWLQPN